MSYLYLLILVLFSGMVTVIAKFYNIKNAQLEGSSSAYNMIYPIGAALAYGVAYLTDPGFEPGVLLYSLSYGLFYTLFTIGITGAIRSGSSSITALVKQTALVGTSVWGFFFFSVPVTVNAVIGMLLIVASLCLCLIEKKKQGADASHKKDLRLPLYLLLIAAGNIGCPVTHKYLLMRYDGKHGYMMLFFGVLLSAIISTARALKGKQKIPKKLVLSSGHLPIFAGASSAMTGIMQTILLNMNMSTSVLYPTLAVGGLIVTLIFSIFSFKERLRPAQWCGIAVGCAALVLLNL